MTSAPTARGARPPAARPTALPAVGEQRRAFAARPRRAPRARRAPPARACTSSSTRSDSPVPRLSNRIRRPKRRQALVEAADRGRLPQLLDLRDPAGQEQHVQRALADDLVGDARVAAARVARRRHLSHLRSARGTAPPARRSRPPRARDGQPQSEVTTRTAPGSSSAFSRRTISSSAESRLGFGACATAITLERIGGAGGCSKTTVTSAPAARRPALEHVHQPRHRRVAVLPPRIRARADHVHPVHEPAHCAPSLRHLRRSCWSSPRASRPTLPAPPSAASGPAAAASSRRSSPQKSSPPDGQRGHAEDPARERLRRSRRAGRASPRHPRRAPARARPLDAGALARLEHALAARRGPRPRGTPAASPRARAARSSPLLVGVGHRARHGEVARRPRPASGSRRGRTRARAARTRPSACARSLGQSPRAAFRRLEESTENSGRQRAPGSSRRSARPRATSTGTSRRRRTRTAH
jgi:hypothetical protein